MMFPPSELAVVTGLFDLVNFHHIEVCRFRRLHSSLVKSNFVIRSITNILLYHLCNHPPKLEMWQPAPIPSCMPLNGQYFGGRLGPKSVPIYGSCLDNSREMMSVIIYLGGCNMVERRITKIIRRNQ